MERRRKKIEWISSIGRRCFLISSGVSAWLLCSRRPSILLVGTNHFRKLFSFNKQNKTKKKKKRCLCFQNSLVRERFISSLVTFVVQLITVGKKMIISLKLVVGCCCIFSSVAHPVDVFSAFTSLRSLFVIQTFFSFVFLKKNLPKRCFSSPVRTCRAHYRTLFTFSQIREKTFRLNWAGVHNGA